MMQYFLLPHVYFKMAVLMQNSNSEFESLNLSEVMTEVQIYDCLYNKYSREFRDKYKKMNSWTKNGTKFGITAKEGENFQETCVQIYKIS